MPVMSIAALLAVTVMVVLCGTAQAATTLHTPIAFASGQSACFVTNVDTRPITVTVTMTDNSGNTLTSVVDSCNGTPLGPRRSCQFRPPPDADGFCTVVSSSSKVRASLNIFGSDNLITVVPATK